MEINEFRRRTEHDWSDAYVTWEATNGFYVFSEEEKILISEAFDRWKLREMVEVIESEHQ